MENASKALIIAGAILVSILIIGIGMAVINATSNVTGGAQQEMDKQQLETFNSKYTTYVGENRGSKVKTLINAMIANNANEEDYKVTLTLDGTLYAEDKLNTALSKVSNTKTYTVEVDMDKNGRVNNVKVDVKS